MIGMLAHVFYDVVNKLTTYRILFIVFIFRDIPDPFYERMGLKKYKNCYGGLLDDADDLVMYESKVSAAMARSIHLVTIPKWSRPMVCTWLITTLSII